MEYRIFGLAGSPSEEYRRDLQELVKLDDAQKHALRDWFLATPDYDPFKSPLPADIVASTLLPEQFQRTAQCLRRLLWAWQEYRLQPEDIERDLLLLGLDSASIEAFGPFLASLSTVRQRAWASEYARTQTFDGLPTMDGLNFICDARAVFGGFPSIEQAQDSYKEFLGLVPVVIMELITSDNYGSRERTAIQLSEESFELLRKAVGRVHDQLSILKERTASVAFGTNGVL